MHARKNDRDRIRVMIVEDTRVIREFLESIINSDPRLEVVAAVESAESALRVLDLARPHVISMDIRLPGMNGFEATQRIMERRPTPIVVVSASVESADLKISMNALRAGALAVVEKPVGQSHHEYNALAERLCTQLAIMSQVKVIRQRFNHRERRPRERTVEPRRGAFHDVPPSAAQPNLVGIVASTGGPNALQYLLSALPSNYPLPIAIVQHMTASFHDGFVSWLRDICPLSVVEARDGVSPEPGTVYVAPAEKHLLVGRGALRVVEGEPVCANRPSGTLLFQSMAECLGRHAVGVLLTGMGRDGAEGLREIRLAGGLTIAEDESSAIVYGMPRAAVEIGAACETLPLPTIAGRLRQLADADSVGNDHPVTCAEEVTP